METIKKDGYMEEVKEMIVRKADNLGIAFVHRHPFVCPFYNIKTYHCSEMETFDVSDWSADVVFSIPGRCPHPFLETEDGDVLCMLELEEEFDWDKIAGRLKIHKGEKA